MNLFDLHCDTALELYLQGKHLSSNDLAVSLDGYKDYNKKAQLFAVWSQKGRTDNECFEDFLAVTRNFHNELEMNKDRAVLCTNSEQLAEDDKRLKCVLCVEDARLVGNDLSRIGQLYESGVRVLTLGWEGQSRFCGSFDTDEGLTPSGFDLLRESERLGIAIDVSHLSERSFWDVAGRAERPFFASHSDSMSLCSHRRNLTDTQFRTIVEAGGVVGVNLVGKHLSAALADGSGDEGTALENVCAHIEHFLEIDEKHVCLGMDMDGTDSLCGLENVSLAVNIARALINRGCPEKTVDALFYDNAFAFIHSALEKA